MTRPNENMIVMAIDVMVYCDCCKKSLQTKIGDKDYDLYETEIYVKPCQKCLDDAKTQEPEPGHADLLAACEHYAECGDGCTCGDGWSHDVALAAIAKTEAQEPDHEG